MSKISKNSNLENIVNKLKLFKETNIIRLDENVVLYSLGNENSEIETFSKNKVASYKALEHPEYKIYTSNGLLIQYNANLIATVFNKDNKQIGYVIQLANDIKTHMYEDGHVENGVIAIIDEKIANTKDDVDSFFNTDEIKKIDINNVKKISNGIDNEKVESIIDEIDSSLRLDDIIGNYELHFRGKRYKYSRKVWTDTITNRQFSNIGKFIEI